MLIKWHIIFVVDVFLVILCKPEWEAIQDLTDAFTRFSSGNRITAVSGAAANRHCKTLILSAAP